MKNLNTKESIEKVALDLFSKKGYRAVTIREIGKQVGIKESSIYYHFENKQAIMNSILQKIIQLIEQMKSNFDQAFLDCEIITDEAMCDVSVGLLKNYLLHPMVHKMISVLTVERIWNKEAFDTYHKFIFEMPLNQQEKVFEEMISRGFIKNNNAKVLANEYYSIIYLAFQKNCLGCEVTNVSVQTAIVEVRENVLDLYHKMKGE